MTAGFESLIPTLVVLAAAVILKRSFEPLVLGCIVGYAMLSGLNFGESLLNGVLTVMADETVRWILFVVSLFGAIINLLTRSGGVLAFANLLGRYIKSGSQALLATWGLGLAVFIDDYLNALSVGASMQKLTDRMKVSREMLAYVVDTTAAPVCILIPFSTWAIYVSGLLESNGVAGPGDGLGFYIGSIPYMIYAWVAMLMVPLVALGVIPPMFGMKAAEEKVKSREPGTPEIGQVEVNVLDSDESNVMHSLNFIIPMLSLILFTWLFEIDVLKGAAVTLLITIVLFRAQKLFSFHEIFDTSIDGVKNMVEVILILVMSFVLKEVNDQLHLTEFVIDVGTTYVSPALLPAVTFISLSTIAFCTGTFWGLYAVALPIILPLAQTMDLNTNFIVGTVISAGAFGSHACFYSDSTVLSAKGSGCPPIQHALTQFPYALIAAAISTVIILLLSLAM